MAQRILLLGTLEIEDADPEISAAILRSPYGSALLAYFLVTRRPQSRESIAALLWDGPSTSETLSYLRKMIYRVLPLLPGLHVTRQRLSYALGEEDFVDLYALESALAGDDPAALDRGLALYRGELLAGFYLDGATGYGEWLLLERERLRRQVWDGYRRLCKSYGEEGLWPQGIAATRRWLLLDRLDEEVHRHLLRFLAADGQVMAAKQHYLYCRRLLWDELGVEPEPATVDLYEQLQAADRHLRDPAEHPLVIGSHQYWGEAPSTEQFFGRRPELAELEQWLTGGKVQLMTILGMGGQGKTSLAAKAARANAAHFAGVYWRSLINAPPVEMLLHDYLRFLSHNESAPPDDIPAKLAQIHGHLRRERHLLVLDNLETVLDAERAGHFRRGYETFEQLLHLFGDGGHQSALLLTSREAPLLLARLDGHTGPVRTLSLNGLSADAGAEMLATRQIAVNAETVTALIRRYSGNPLALQLAAQTIEEFFLGDGAAFLAQESLMFEDIRDVLERQFARLSPLEQEIMRWLAITREATDPITLAGLMNGQASRTQLLDAMKRLQRRSLVERERLGFTLQNVVTEYVTNRIVEQVSEEVIGGEVDWLHAHPLILAQAKEYVRQSQEQLLLQPVAQRVAARLGREGLRARASQLLDQMRASGCGPVSGFAAGNLLNLLRILDIDIAGCDFSRLTIRQANLRGWSLPQVNFSGAHFLSSLFTANFSTPHCVAIHPAGHLLAVGTASGEVRLWTPTDAQPVRLLEGHTNRVAGVAFSPDGALLAAAGLDDTLSLWDLNRGYALRRLALPTAGGGALAFSPDGQLLATGGKDGRVSLWEVASGQLLYQMETEVVWVYSLAFHPAGKLLACGGRQEVVNLWDLSLLDGTGARGQVDRASLRPVASVPTAHAPVMTLAFTPDGAWLLSGGGGNVTEVWDVEHLDATGVKPTATLAGDTTWVRAIAITPDGRTLAGGSGEGLIYLSDLPSGRRLDVLTGHRNAIHSLAFDPAGVSLVSAADDDTIRIWHQAAGHRWQISTILQSHTPASSAVAFSPDGKLLAVGDTVGFVHLWQGDHTHSAACQHQVLSGHTNSVQALAFRPDGRMLATIGLDKTARIWDLQPGDGGSPRCVNVLSGHTKTLYAVGFGPDGQSLFYSDGDGAVRMWAIDDRGQTRNPRFFQRDGVAIVSVALHPQGGYLLETKYSGAPHLWEIREGKYVMQLPGLREVTSLVFSPTGDTAAAASSEGHIGLWDMASPSVGRLLGLSPRCGSTIRQIAYAPDAASIAGACEDGAIRLWNPQHLESYRTLPGHTGAALAVAFRPDGALLASGGSDGAVNLWNPVTGMRVNTLALPRPYAGMNISGVTGISEAQRAALKSLGAVERAGG